MSFRFDCVPAGSHRCSSQPFKFYRAPANHVGLWEERRVLSFNDVFVILCDLHTERESAMLFPLPRKEVDLRGMLSILSS